VDDEDVAAVGEVEGFGWQRRIIHEFGRLGDEESIGTPGPGSQALHGTQHPPLDELIGVDSGAAVTSLVVRPHRTTPPR
jgi:hypothetical protein